MQGRYRPPRIFKRNGNSMNRADEILTRRSRAAARGRPPAERLDSLRPSGAPVRAVDRTPRTVRRRPDDLELPETVDDGNGILSHVFGNKNVSRQVASRAAGRTGIGADLLKRMLPMVATLVMGTLARRTSGAAASRRPQAPDLWACSAALWTPTGTARWSTT